MADWIIPALTVVATVVSSGAVGAYVAGRNDASKRRDAATAEDRKDAVGILREILSTERTSHQECQERLSALEARHASDREDCIRQTTDLERRIALLERKSSTPSTPVVR